MKRFLLAWGVGAISLYLVSLLLGPNLEIGSFWDVVWASLLLGLLNAILAPLLNLLTCPLYLLTLGLSRFLVTGALILLADWAIPGFEVAGFLWAVLAAILISITTTFLSTQVRGGEGGRGH